MMETLQSLMPWANIYVPRQLISCQTSLKDASGRSADVPVHRLGDRPQGRGRGVLPGGPELQEQGLLQRLREVHHPHHHDPGAGRSAEYLLRLRLVLLMETGST